MLNLSEGEKKYIGMCLTCGFNRILVSGDHVFDGEQIHVLAEDFIGVSQHREMNVIDVTVKDDSTGLGDSFNVRYTNRMLKDYIWLPTTDQLIQLYCEDSETTQFDFYNNLSKELSKYERYYKKSYSFCEMVLKFHMEKVYNKTWTGESWKVIGEMSE